MKKTYLILFIVFLFLSYSNITNLCRGFFPLLFDNQILLSWQYWAEKGLIPYKDIYYQYGILFFYKGHSVIFSLIYYLVTPLLFTYFYFIFQKVTKSKVISVLSAVCLFIFAAYVVGFEIFTRYGTLLALVFMLADILFSYKNDFPSKKIFIMGILGGLIFSLLNDTGIYAQPIILFLIIIDSLIRNNVSKTNKVIVLVKRIGVEMLGFATGFIPYGLYLVKVNSLTSFVNSILELSDLQLIAKTPFFHGIFAFDSLFVVLVLFLSITFISYKLYKGIRPNLITYLEISSISVLIVLEQKNIWRHIDSQLTFIAFILLIFLFIDLSRVAKKLQNIHVLFFTVLISLLTYFILFSRISNTQALYTCQNRFNLENTSQAKVINFLVKEKDFNGKVFSFPSDTIFYILSDQKPPYYPTVFEGSSLSGQEKLINYIKKENIKYVIYNYKNVAVQDGVPNFARVKTLHKYILENFNPISIIEDFVIFKRNTKKNDFFNKKNIVKYEKYLSFLKDVDLGNIPRSEGINKNNSLDNKDLIVSGTKEEINKYLSKNKITSDHLFIALKYSSNYLRRQTQLVFMSQDGTNSSASFNACLNDESCILDLNALPVFYLPREIIKVESNDKDLEGIKLYKISHTTNFW